MDCEMKYTESYKLVKVYYYFFSFVRKRMEQTGVARKSIKDFRVYLFYLQNKFLFYYVNCFRQN